MIRSAREMASAMAHSSSGDGFPSHCTSFPSVNMLAVINNTRLRRLPETRRLRQVADSSGSGQGNAFAKHSVKGYAMLGEIGRIALL
jgi:hypothetical protein